MTNTYTKSEWQPQPQEGMLRVTKEVKLPEGVTLPEDYKVTLTVKEGDTEVDSKTFGYHQLVYGSASFDIYGVSAGEHTYTISETVSHGNGQLVIDGVYYDLTAVGTGSKTVTVNANQINKDLVVTNTYTKSEWQPSDTEPALTITKAADDSSVTVGDEVTYTITVKNTGDADAENVVITDTLPAGVTYVSITGSGDYDADTRTVTWEIGTLAEDNEASVTVTVTADTTGTLTNVAAAVADGVDEVQDDAGITVTSGGTTPVDPTPGEGGSDDGYDDEDDNGGNGGNGGNSGGNGGEVDIPGGDVPQGGQPGGSGETDIPGGDVPGAADPGVSDPGAGDPVEIVEGDVPMGNLPQTGTMATPANPTVTLGMLAMSASLAAAGLAITISRKREEDFQD